MPRCPTDCSGRESTRQHKLNHEKLIEAGLPVEDWLSDAWRCGYCDCVYSYEWDSDSREYITTERGKFGGNTLIAAENWEPVDRRVAIVERGR